MKRLKQFIVLMCAMVMTSCGLIELEEIPSRQVSMHFEQDTIYCMVGEEFSLTPVIEPDTVLLDGLYWFLSNDTVLSVADGTFTAMKEGWVVVEGTNPTMMLLDSCHVCVLPLWAPEAISFPYETIIYAQVRVDGGSFDPATMQVAAYVGRELRGVGRMVEYSGIQYMEIRVGSEFFDFDELSGERITFRLYERTQRRVRQSDTVLQFDGCTHGTLSNLFTLNF